MSSMDCNCGGVPDAGEMESCPRHAAAARALEVLSELGHPIPVQPIPMVLHCPVCGMQHIDAPDLAAGWTNPPHKSHECQGCKARGRRTVWRAADVHTVGVAATTTRGERDNWWPGIEAELCTGITASWCPVHGDCSCPDDSDDRSDDGCPLHSRTSRHGDGEES